MSKLVEILVQGSQIGKITGQEGGAEQFPESAEFFPHSASDDQSAIQSSELDGQVDQFLCPGKCPLGSGILACLESLQDTGCLAADVGHLLRERHLGPSAVFQRGMLHLSDNELFDNLFDGFPDIRIPHVSSGIILPRPDVDQRIVFNEIFAFLFRIQVEPP